MAQSRLHGVATIYTRLEGMVKVGAISNVDIPIWFNVYKRFPPRRPPDAERPLVQKPLKPILYPEDNLRAQFYKTYHNSTMSGDKGLLTAENFKGGIAEAFLNSFEIVKKLRPQYYDDDVWYLTQRWIHDGMGEGNCSYGILIILQLCFCTAAKVVSETNNLPSIRIGKV